jgi:hypothetical protein
MAAPSHQHTSEQACLVHPANLLRLHPLQCRLFALLLSKN